MYIAMYVCHYLNRVQRYSQVKFNGYTMETSGLPDICTRSPGPETQGLRVYISGKP